MLITKLTRNQILCHRSRKLFCFKDRHFSLSDSRKYEKQRDEIDEILAKQALDKPKYLKKFHDDRNVLVIQPRSKGGPQKAETMSRTSPQLQLEEAVSLVRTLKNWNVIDQKVVGTSNINQRYFFGYGKIEEIARMVATNPKIDTIFLSVNKMHGWQQYELEKAFGVEVYDRFSVVLQIFNDHAKSKEAKLQVALAEIPYIRSRLRQITQTKRDRATGTMGQCGSGETYLQLRQRLLDEREIKLRKALDAIIFNRDQLRSKRLVMKIPTVSVVGYTNSGKTSLIKILTDDNSLEPKDDLFATLDLTVHGGRLKSLNRVLYVDTVGFIRDIPPSLIQAFNATLKEVTLSDLVIHVYDASSPDLKNQRLTVDQILSDELKIGSKLSSTTIHVGNKMDKLSPETPTPTWYDILTSATKGTNIAQLKEEIEKRLLKNMAYFNCETRIEMGSPPYYWLQQNCNIVSQSVDKNDQNYILMHIGFNQITFGQFKKYFGSKFFQGKDFSAPATQRYTI